LVEIIVADPFNHRIQKLSPDGTFITKWGTQNSGNGQFNLPVGIAADMNGHIYVIDGNNHRIQEFTSDGEFITKWGG